MRCVQAGLPGGCGHNSLSFRFQVPGSDAKILDIGIWLLSIVYYSQQIERMETTKDIKSVSDFVNSVLRKLQSLKGKLRTI